MISRNGHKEFLDLKVQGSKVPGDEISLAGAGTVQVTVKWTANQRIGGRIELVRNGVVVASKQATATGTSPVTLSANIDFPQSGWLAARRMDGGGHKLHTAAAFVTVGGAPIRASASDPKFYVQWIDSLLQKTSPGGEWSSYFLNNREEAHARYQEARALFDEIASGGVTPPAAGEQTIFSDQLPPCSRTTRITSLGRSSGPMCKGQSRRFAYTPTPPKETFILSGSGECRIKQWSQGRTSRTYPQAPKAGRCLICPLRYR